MKTRLFVVALAVVMPLHAATHAVLPGTSIQAKIAIAAPGDIVAIFGGTYNEDLTINKAIRLVEVSGQDVTITGSISFTGITDAPPFEGFNVGSAGKGITATNTTGLLFRNLDLRAGTGVSSSGSSILKINSCQLSNLYPGGGTVEIWSSSLTGNIDQTTGDLYTTSVTIAGNFDTQTAALKTVAFRTTVTGDNNWRSKRGWFGYSKTRSFNYHDANQAKLVVVGCTIDRQDGQANGIYCNAINSKLLISNNNIVRVAYQYPGDAKNGIDLRGVGNTAVVSNNYCQLQFLGYDPFGNLRGDGIYVRDFTQATIINNIVVGAKHGISAPFGAVAKNNLYWASPWNGALLEANGVVAEGTLYMDPLFIATEAPKLQATSPCINAGTPDPRFNDRDGSRNNIGPSGGAWFDPDGWATENPVVISFDLSPDQVLEGVEPEIILSEGQAVSAP